MLLRIPTTLKPSNTRSYALAVRAPVVFPGQSSPRKFETRKAFLYNQYSRIIETSQHAPLLFLSYDQFSAKTMEKLRRDLMKAHAKVPVKEGEEPLARASLTVARSPVLGAVLRESQHINPDGAKQLAALCSGPLALLSLPALSPTLLAALIRAVDRAVPARPKTVEAPKTGKKEREDPTNPGRRPVRVKPTLVPSLQIVGAILEGQLFLASEIRDVSKLPELKELHAQILGLLSTPAARLVGLLSDASGGKIVRTLEGLKEKMEGES